MCYYLNAQFQGQRVKLAFSCTVYVNVPHCDRAACFTGGERKAHRHPTFSGKSTEVILGV